MEHSLRQLMDGFDHAATSSHHRFSLRTADVSDDHIIIDGCRHFAFEPKGANQALQERLDHRRLIVDRHGWGLPLLLAWPTVLPLSRRRPLLGGSGASTSSLSVPLPAGTLPATCLLPGVPAPALATIVVIPLAATTPATPPPTLALGLGLHSNDGVLATQPEKALLRLLQHLDIRLFSIVDAQLCQGRLDRHLHGLSPNFNPFHRYFLLRRVFLADRDWGRFFAVSPSPCSWDRSSFPLSTLADGGVGRPSIAKITNCCPSRNRLEVVQ